MPRPGPRPYECVRRAWHSDRHQPMRGSIIQQIFRVVNESHNPATRKNKEWQEKLPVVVFKAEEIMYSKANSEAEYMDLGTLWDRVNDAINTIIRREETTETGDLLPPCVEVKASRSQRQANPRTYLSPRTQEPNFVPPQTSNSTHLAEPNRHVMQNNSRTNPNSSSNFAFPSREVPSSGNDHFIPVETNPGGLVYPLYNGTHLQPVMPNLGFQVPRNPNAILVGTPIFPSTSETTQVGSHMDTLFSRERDESASNRGAQADSGNRHDKAPEMGFDLSLRLGSFEDPCMKPDKVLARDLGNADLSSYHKEFSFFPVETGNDPFGSRKSQRNPESEGQNAEAAFRKRKAPFDDNLDDDPFLQQEELRSNQFTGRMKRPGS